MARNITPFSLARSTIGKVGSLFHTKSTGSSGSPLNPLKNIGKSIEHKILGDFFTIASLVLLAMTILLCAIIFFQFILIIINKSALITPQYLFSSSLFPGGPGGSIDCTPEYEPLGFPNTATNPTASRAWVIVNDLHRGFWCYWNKSAIYPELFDNGLFLTMPFPDPFYAESHYINMFWCSWLPIKSFSETGSSICPGCLWVPDMIVWFEGQGRYIPIAQALENPTANIHQGDAIFFQWEGSPVRADHVGIVWSVNSQYITTIESNAGLKSLSYTITGSDAAFGTLHVIGFGRR